jgi:hypothetical protein
MMAPDVDVDLVEMKNHNIVLESINIIKVDIQDLPHDPPTPL